MKTNVTMKSTEDRNLFGVVIRQDTKNSFLSLTDLQEAYTRARIKNGWNYKGEIQHIIAQKENAERIYYILSEQKLINCDFSQFMEMIGKDGIVKVLKHLNVYKTTGRGTNKQTVCNPYIWVLVAMELNPMLYAKVVTWLTDKLIFNRIEACDLNKDLRSEVAKFPSVDYARLNMALNEKVFGYHQTGMRNFASEQELDKLTKLECAITFCIQNGIYKTFDDVVNGIKNSK